jgi:hypothetical protein
MNAKEKRRIIAASKSWQAFGKPLGWRLQWFSYEHHATFVGAGGMTFSVSLEMREDIGRAIAGQPYPEHRDHEVAWCNCVHASYVIAFDRRPFSADFDRPWCGRNCGKITRRKRDATCAKCHENMATLEQIRSSALSPKKKATRRFSTKASA